MFILTMSLQVQPMTGRVLELPTLPGRLSHLLYRMPSLSSAGTFDFLIRPSTVSTGLAEMSAFLPVPLSLALSLSLSLSLSLVPSLPLSLSHSLSLCVTLSRAHVRLCSFSGHTHTGARPHTRAHPHSHHHAFRACTHAHLLPLYSPLLDHGLTTYDVGVRGTPRAGTPPVEWLVKGRNRT